MIAQNLGMYELYFVIRSKTGWLADCFNAGFTKDQMDYLELLDTEMTGCRPDDELAEWDRQIEREGGADVYFADNQEEKIRALSRQIAEVYSDYERSARADEPYADRAVRLALSGAERMEKLRRGIRGRQLHKDEVDRAVADGTMPPDRISDQDIERARAFPLERLIPDFEMARYGYILCRWHTDKRPSMLVKNGFGFCFSCQKSVDSIRWLMEIENMGFVDAVKHLRGR